VNNLRDLQQKTGASTMKDLFNSAMSIYQWAVEETMKGNKIVSLDEDDRHYRVLLTPPLQTVAREFQLEKA